MRQDGNFQWRQSPAELLAHSERLAPWSRLSPAQFRGLVVGLAVVMGALTFVTWGRVRVLANGYEIMGLRQQRDALLARNQRLQRRIADLRSLDYVEATARGRLGMVDINPNQVIVLKPESTARRLADDVEAFFGARGSSAPRP